MAALTLPTLIQKNNNHVVETRLMKFYSSINQAIKMAEVDYGDKKYWAANFENLEFDKNGKPLSGYDWTKWFNKYIVPYMKIIKIETNWYGVTAYFPDGSAVNMFQNGRDWSYYPGGDTKCTEKGVCRFDFMFYPPSKDPTYWLCHYNKGVEPWKYYSNCKYESLKRACYSSDRSYCSSVIQMNGWKIPDDYPYKVRY